jgi:hypothetical protein
MSLRKRTSVILGRADLRLASLRSIDESLDLGNGLTLDSYSMLIDTLRNQLSTYNQALSTIDQTRSSIEQLERQLSSVSEKMLLGVAIKYGKESDEYVMAGGSRRVYRPRRSAKAVAAVATSID